MSTRRGRYPTALTGAAVPTGALQALPPLVEADEAILLLLDPETDLDCCKQDCEQRADWYRRCRSCSALYPVCDHHRITEMSWLQSQLWIGCSNCPAATFGLLWESVFQYLPLGGEH